VSGLVIEYDDYDDVPGRALSAEADFSRAGCCPRR